MPHIPKDGKRRARRLSRGFGAGAAALTVAGAAPTSLSGPFLVMAALMGSLTWKAEDIAKDPPRADWDQATGVSFHSVRLDLFPLGPERAATRALVQIDAYMPAGLAAFERAQGASLAGEIEAEGARLQEAFASSRDVHLPWRLEALRSMRLPPNAQRPLLGRRP